MNNKLILALFSVAVITPMPSCFATQEQHPSFLSLSTTNWTLIDPFQMPFQSNLITMDPFPWESCLEHPPLRNLFLLGPTSLPLSTMSSIWALSQESLPPKPPVVHHPSQPNIQKVHRKPTGHSLDDPLFPVDQYRTDFSPLLPNWIRNHGKATLNTDGCLQNRQF